MKIINKTTVALVLFSCSITLAQEAKQDAKKEFSKVVFKASPQHFAVNTLKIGLEIFPNPTRSVSIYLGGRTGRNSSDYYYPSDQFDGFLGELQYRKYVKPIEAITTRRNRTHYQGIYVSAFLQGGYYYGDFIDTEWTYDPVTGASNYIEYAFSQKGWNAAGGFTIGVQRILWDVLYIDFYVGGGMQLSGIKKSGDLPPNNFTYFFSNSINDPNYEGIIPKIGVQIGLGL